MSASQAQATTASTSTFITSLVLNLIIAGVELIAFTLIRRQFKTIYEPRTFIPEERNRESPLSPSLLGWPWALIKSDPKLILAKNGVDAYVFVRFLRMVVKILFPIWIISWLVLMPINAANTGVSGRSGLDKFTFANVGLSSQSRYAAHLILSYLFTAWILYNLRDEMREWVTVRQRYLISEEHSSLPQASTILVTGIPTAYLHEEKLKQLYSHLPGGIKKIWLNRNLKEMPDLYEMRLKACTKLESAETNLAKTAAKLRLKAEKASKKKNAAPLDEKWNTTGNLENDQTLAEKLVPAKKRPSHRLPPFKWFPFALPFMGQKVDTIDWCRDKIIECTQALHTSRTQLDKDKMAAHLAEDVEYPPLNSAFILFNQQIAAHMAAATLNHHQPYTMHKRFLELAPDDVIWGNLGMNSYEQQIRFAISWAITIALILFWAIPVAFVGIVSNVSGLCAKFSWMEWLCKLPSVVVGIISGVLPPVLLAVLFMLLPIVLRLLAKFEGIPRRTGLELSLMTRYFIFLFIHGFIITTLASGLMPAVAQLASNPSSVATILATNLPLASNFFLTYVALQGIAGAAGNFIQYVPLAIYYVKLFLLGSTPRSVYNIKYTMRNTSWGTTFPNVTLLVVITLGYSLISPVINGLACFSFMLLFLAWKYLFTWVYDNPPATETGGLFFPKAITHVFCGLYVQQVCMCALFFLARDQNGKAKSIPQGALMIVLIVLTVGFQLVLNDSYNPLEMSLPLSLAHKSYGMPTETGHEGSVIGDDEQSATHDKAPLNPLKTVNSEEEKGERFELQPTGASSPSGPSSTNKLHSKIDDAFSHPAAYEDQKVIWLAKDDLGVSEEAVRLLMASKVRATMRDTEMNAKGKVDITGPPPETTHHEE